MKTLFFMAFGLSLMVTAQAQAQSSGGDNRIGICQPKTNPSTGVTTYRSEWLPKKAAEKRIADKLACSFEVAAQKGQPHNVPCSCSTGGGGGSQPVFDVVASITQNTTYDNSGGTNQFSFMIAPAAFPEFAEVFSTGFTNLVVTASESTSSTTQCRHTMLTSPWTESGLSLPVVMSASNFVTYDNFGPGNQAGDLFLNFNSDFNPGATIGLTSQGNLVPTANVHVSCDPSVNGPMTIRIQLFRP